MARSLLERQLARVRRRLFLTTLVTCLAWGLLTAALVAAVWIAVQPYLVSEAPEALRWVVTAGVALVMTVVACAVAARRAPSAVAAALALDERFDLKERVTTSLSLTPSEAATPAGRALLADLEGKLSGLRVDDRFPVRVPRLALSMLPPAVLAVMLLGLFWKPTVAEGRGDNDPEVPPLAKEEVEQKMKHLAAKPKAKPIDPAKAEELERINQEIEKFTRAPRQSREEVRDRIKDATALEEQIKRERKEQADRVDAFQEAMKQQERLSRKDREPKQVGPAKPAADALARGDLDKAREELQRLAEKVEKEEEKERLRRKQRDPMATEKEKKQAEDELKQLDRENGMEPKDRDQLAKQLDQLEHDLRRLSRNKDEKEKELRDLADKGEINKDQLDRELDQLEKIDPRLNKQEIDKLAKELSECKQCMKEGKTGEAAKKLAKAGQGGGQKEKDAELAQKLAQIQQVKRALCRTLEGGVGSGHRPEEKDDATGHKDTYAPGEWDKGKTEVIGQGPFGGFNGPRKPAEMQDEIRQAAQEAPAAIDRQRLPPSASKMARGYFEKVRGPEKDKKK